ncbi:MAG: hypothetical protein FJZ01_24155 [Candidatus Sericytochromatia bacterium]|nr:hypothetical protein [Candidatus Tanganyikabacteria bacterium]
MQSSHKTTLRATAGFLAGSLLGCAPAGVVAGLGAGSEPSASVARKPAAYGELTFTFRWPGMPARETQALPNSAKYVVLIIWTDATRKTAQAVRVFRRDNTSDTYFNRMTGRYESSGRLVLPPSDAYVLDLKAYADDPGYKEVFAPTAAEKLTCGSPQATPTPAATASTPAATETATADPTPTPAPTVAPCLDTAKALAYGASAPFKIVPGHATSVRVNLTVPGGPTLSGVSPAVVGSQGGEIVLTGKGFGTDPGKVRLTLVPPFLGPQPFEFAPATVTDTTIKAKLPEGSAGGTVYAFVDGVEAAAATAPTVQAVKRLFLTSGNLRFDQSKVYAAANASVSIGVYGEPIYGGACCWDPGRPNNPPNGAVQLPPSVLTVQPTGTTTATASIGKDGVIVFPDKGTWKIGNPAGIEQSWSDVIAGLYQVGAGAQVLFTRGPWDTNSLVSVLVPDAAEPWFGYGQGVANVVAPQPNAGLYHPDGRLALRADDFTWTTTPSDALSVGQDGSYKVQATKRQDIVFKGAFKLDPTKKVEGTLKTGFTVSVSPGEVSLSQPVTGGTAALTKQQFFFTLTAPNGASASTIPPCNGCTPNIASNQYQWTSSDPTLAKVDTGGLVSVMSSTATGDVSISIQLTADPDRKTSATVHVTNNGGLALDVQ